MKEDINRINILKLIIISTFLYSMINIFLAVCGPLRTDDIFWHIAVGREIIEQKQLPSEEIFLYTADKDQPPLYHEWLFQVAMAKISELYTSYSLRLIHFLLIILIIISIFRYSYGADTYRNLFILSLFLLFSYQRLIQLRPHLFSICFFYYLLGSIRRTGQFRIKQLITKIYLPLIIWVNFHSLTPLIFVYWLIIILNNLLEKKHIDNEIKREFKIFITAVGCLSVNPQFISIYWFYFKGNTRNPYSNVIDEWGHFIPFSGADFLPLSSPVITVLFILILLATIYIGFKRLKSGQIWSNPLFFNSLITIVIIIYAVRFVWLIPVAIKYLLNEYPMKKNINAFLVLTVLVASIIYWRDLDVIKYRFPTFSRRLKEDYLKLREDTYKYHSYVYDFLEQNDEISGRYFTPYYLGGYSEYRFGKRAKVFIDGRFEHYSKEVNEHYSSIRHGGGAALNLIASYSIDKFILPITDEWSRLINTLNNSKNFVPIFKNTHVIVYKNTKKAENP